ncbi:PREDICTED: spermatogenesis-associated protein 16-like, partial [Phaethon lepturus]|uniref:spermatogenesis-associated protein 16-like n=1 Tax=Phaethon lepturus TaxID=97097 RepID=UPI000530653B
MGGGRIIAVSSPDGQFVSQFQRGVHGAHPMSEHGLLSKGRSSALKGNCDSQKERLALPTERFYRNWETDLFLKRSPTEFTPRRAGNSNGCAFVSFLVKSPLILLEGSLVPYGCSEENSCKLASDDSFFAQAKASESNIDFQKNLVSMDGKNQPSQQMHSSKESNAAANKLNDIPEEPQKVKNHLGDGAAENIMERIEMAEKKKEKQSNDVDRASHKEKSENNEKLAVKKEETTLETGNQLILTPLSHIPLKSLMDIEMELVYTDEEDISFEFAEPVESTRTQSACHDSEKAAALSTPNGNALPQIDKQLQMTLQEASTCYRRNNYAAAAEQLSTALKLCSKGSAIDNTFVSSPEDISSIASFIETKLVTCYLKLRKPDDALNHSHRSIILNPAYFRNHLRQAVVFRCLERYSEAARYS